MSILTALLALPVPLFPFSNDVAFYQGKTLWAALGYPFVDPAMGVGSEYPAVYHMILGRIVDYNVLETSEVTRLSLICTFSALLLSMWTLWRRDLDTQTATLSLWVMGLALYGKEWSAHLLSSAATASMLPAVVGWWVFARGKTTLQFVLGAAAIMLAITVWPAHLFSALGVGVVCGFRREFRLRTIIFGASTLGALGLMFYFRSLAGLSSAPTVFQLVPDRPLEFVLTRVWAFMTLGSDGHGWSVGIASLIISVGFVVLVVRGRLRRSEFPSLGPLYLVGIGLTLGSVIALYFMFQSAYMSRLLFVAGVTLSPVATIELLHVPRSKLPRTLEHACLWYAVAAALWLLPTFVAISITAERWRNWVMHSQAATEFLRKNTHQGERIWAGSEDFCEVALGKLPLFGVLGHPWPQYFGASERDSKTFGRAYYSMLDADDLSDWLTTARELGVHWAVISADEQSDAPWTAELRRRYTPAFDNGYWVIFDTSESETTLDHQAD